MPIEASTVRGAAAESRRTPAEDGGFSVPGLTGVRALAAFWVLGFHYFGLLGARALPLHIAGHSFHMQYLLTVGWIGVHVFFVLSGFLLSLPYLRYHGGLGPRPDLPQYLKRRVLRVVPAYWVILAVLIVFAGAIAQPVPALPDLAAFFLMLQGTGAIWPPAGAFWTLAIEFEFYLLLPLLMRVFLGAAPSNPVRVLGRCGLLLLAALAVSMAYRAVAFAWVSSHPVQTEVWFLMNQLPPLLHEFALGICGGALFIHFQRGPGRSRAGSWNLWTGIGLLGTLAMMIVMDLRFRGYWANQPISYYWPVASSAFIACMILGVAGRGWLGRLLFENRLVFAIGTISYSVYLWHFPVGLFFTRIFPKPLDSAGEAAFLAASIGTTLALSTLTYALVERPCIRFSQRRRPSGGPASDPLRAT